MAVALVFGYLTEAEMRSQAHQVESDDYSSDEIKAIINTWCYNAHQAGKIATELETTDSRYYVVKTYALFGGALQILASYPEHAADISAMRPIWEAMEKLLKRAGTVGKTSGFNNNAT